MTEMWYLRRLCFSKSTIQRQLGVLNWNPERENDLLYRRNREREKIIELTDVGSTLAEMHRSWFLKWDIARRRVGETVIQFGFCIH